MKNILHRGSKAIAVIWGFSEATFFFIVPDVYLSYIAITHYKKALFLCLYTVLGAVAGGFMMYMAGRYYPNASLHFLDYIPAISPSVITQAELLIEANVFYGMIKGALTGIPYKIFATHAGQEPVPILLFIVSSIIARLLRFTLVTSMSAFIAKIILRRIRTRIKYYLHHIAWVVFYAAYFQFM